MDSVNGATAAWNLLGGATPRAKEQHKIANGFLLGSRNSLGLLMPVTLGAKQKQRTADAYLVEANSIKLVSFITSGGRNSAVKLLMLLPAGAQRQHRTANFPLWAQQIGTANPSHPGSDEVAYDCECL